MRLAISNIAWDVTQDAAVARLLQEFEVDAIDVAPGKYFPDPLSATDDQIAAVKHGWAQRGIEITGMQSLLFGTTGLNVFGGDRSQAAMLAHLGAVCRIGAGLGASRLVFGSPKNRDRSGLSDARALEVAVDFFRRLGDVAQEQGVMVCLEPNPARYGANFMTSSAETAQVVSAVAHSAIRMQFDTGALTINDESPEAVLASSAGLIGHVHASEPDLLPVGQGGTDHQQMHRALLAHLPEHLVTIEMLTANQASPLESIRSALGHAVHCYRPAPEAGR